MIILVASLLPAVKQHKDLLFGVLDDGIDLDVIFVVPEGVFELLANPFDTVQREAYQCYDRDSPPVSNQYSTAYLGENFAAYQPISSTRQNGRMQQ